MSGTNWDRRFTELAHHVAGWSRDPSTKCGAVLVNHEKVVVGMGYNGFPRGVRDAPERYADRATKYALVVHAEANAILNACGSVRGTTAYCTWHPCSGCAKLLIQAGVITVVCPEPDARWADDARFATLMFEEAGVVVRRPRED